jgi:hypothetical protein
MSGAKILFVVTLLPLMAAAATRPPVKSAGAADPFAQAALQIQGTDLPGLRLAIEDLTVSFGARYAGVGEFDAALRGLESRLRRNRRSNDPD